MWHSDLIWFLVSVDIFTIWSFQQLPLKSIKEIKKKGSRVSSSQAVHGYLVHGSHLEPPKTHIKVLHPCGQPTWRIPTAWWSPSRSVPHSILLIANCKSTPTLLGTGEISHRTEKKHTKTVTGWQCHVASLRISYCKGPHRQREKKLKSNISNSELT